MDWIYNVIEFDVDVDMMQSSWDKVILKVYQNNRHYHTHILS
jgi:hypothetical protein